MSRIVKRPIAVTRWRNDEPEVFLDNEVSHQVTIVIDKWMEMGSWWQGDGERRMMRVWTNQNALFDLEEHKQEWFIYKTWD